MVCNRRCTVTCISLQHIPAAYIHVSMRCPMPTAMSNAVKNSTLSTVTQRLLHNPMCKPNQEALQKEEPERSHTIFRWHPKPTSCLPAVGGGIEELIKVQVDATRARWVKGAEHVAGALQVHAHCQKFGQRELAIAVGVEGPAKQTTFTSLGDQQGRGRGGFDG